MIEVLFSIKLSIHILDSFLLARSLLWWSFGLVTVNESKHQKMDQEVTLLVVIMCLFVVLIALFSLTKRFTIYLL